jgi:hypothetical protein
MYALAGNTYGVYVEIICFEAWDICLNREASREILMDTLTVSALPLWDLLTGGTF